MNKWIPLFYELWFGRERFKVWSNSNPQHYCQGILFKSRDIFTITNQNTTPLTTPHIGLEKGLYMKWALISIKYIFRIYIGYNLALWLPGGPRYGGQTFLRVWFRASTISPAQYTVSTIGSKSFSLTVTATWSHCALTAWLNGIPRILALAKRKKKRKNIH